MKQLSDLQNDNFQKYRITIAQRGPDANFIRLVEEVGELAKAIRDKDLVNMCEEAADVLAWLMTVCSVHGIDLDLAYDAKYGDSTCFRCGHTPCDCPEHSKARKQ